MSCYKNDPFTVEGWVHPQISYQEFLKLLIEFEGNIGSDCLSVFLKGKFREQDNAMAYHIDCGSSASRFSGCNNCKICKDGKYQREQFLKYVYGITFSKRGNILK